MDMKDISTTLKPEDFLAHTDFVRGLARSLIADASRADDVVQETWIAALRRPPAKAGSVRAWLARVVRNLVATTYRAEGRRARREKRAAAGEAVPSTEEIFQREAIRRRVVEAVVALDEPYRSAVVLRYYEDLPPREIARRLGTPVATVRTHIHRGLEKLRQKFDADHGNDRRPWCVALAPIAGLELLSSTAGGATGAAAVMTGAIAMSAKVKIAAIVILVPSLSVALWQILPDSFFLDDDPRPAAAEDLPIAPAVERDNKERQDDLLVGIADPGGATGSEREALGPIGLFIAGRVVEKGTAKPIATYGLSLYRNADSPSTSWKKVTVESVHHAGGRFHVPVEEGGLYRLRISTPSYLRGEPEDFEVADETSVDTILIELDPGMAVSGRVVVDATDQPVVDALIVSDRTNWRDRERLLVGRSQDTPHVRTDEEGRFRIQGLSDERQTIAALHPDFAQAGQKATPGDEEEIEIRLKGGFRLFGRALCDDGKPAVGLRINAAHLDDQIWRPVFADLDGRYRTRPVRPGLVQVGARPPEGETEESFGFSSESKEVEVDDADKEVNFGLLPEHITFRGTLFGYDGASQPGGFIFLRRVFADPTKFNMRGANSYTDHCDDQGRFEIRKIVPGRFDVSAALSDRTFPSEKVTLSLETPGTIEKNISFAELIDPDATGRISGVVIDGATGAPIETNDVANVMAWLPDVAKSFNDSLDHGGRFTIENLPAGRYRLYAQVWGFPQVTIDGVDLEKGQVIGNLVIEIPAGGMLRNRVSGFGVDDPKELEIAVQHGEKQRVHYEPFQIGDDGSWEKTWTYETGKWTVTFTVDGLGMVEKTCHVERGQTVEVHATRAEFENPDFGVIVTVTGRVTSADGQPVSGVTTSFIGWQVPGGIDEADRTKTGVTDSKGQFTVTGLIAGRWWVSVDLGEGRVVVFPALSVPRNPPGTIRRDLELQGGSVSGVLYDSHTGREFDEARSEWSLYAQNTETNRTMSKIEKGRRGSRFQLLGLPAGEYIVSVNARGYERYYTEPFEHDGMGDVDVGRIGLEPSGIVDLAVTDTLGGPITDYQVLFNGNNRYQWDRHDLPDGRIRYDKLPLGDVAIEVHADGFKPARTQVTTSVDSVEEVTVALEPEQSRLE